MLRNKMDTSPNNRNIFQCVQITFSFRLQAMPVAVLNQEINLPEIYLVQVPEPQFKFLQPVNSGLQSQIFYF